MNEEKNRKLSLEEKEEVKSFIEEKLFTQIDGVESYLRDLFQMTKGTDCASFARASRFGIRRLNELRSDFQIMMDLGDI